MKFTTTRGVQLSKGKIIAESDEITVRTKPRETLVNIQLTDAEKTTPLMISLDKFLKNRDKNEVNKTDI